MSFSDAHPEIAALLREHDTTVNYRTIDFNAAASYLDPFVAQVLASSLSRTPYEGYPSGIPGDSNPYAGGKALDKLHKLAVESAKKAFSTEESFVQFANVMSFSASVANRAVWDALLPTETTYSSPSFRHAAVRAYNQGGHFTHGGEGHMTAHNRKIHTYGSFEELEHLLKTYPISLVITSGGSNDSRAPNYAKYRRLIDKIESKRNNEEEQRPGKRSIYLWADISHTAGLVAGGAYPNPIAYDIDIVTFSAAKSLGGAIGSSFILWQEPQLSDLFNSKVFPASQGQPNIAAMVANAAVMEQWLEPDFKQHAARVVENAKALAARMNERGLNLVSKGTDSHMVLIDLRSLGIKGKEACEFLEAAGILTTALYVPEDRPGRDAPSGLRMGTVAATSLNMKPHDMVEVADAVASALYGLAKLKKRGLSFDAARAPKAEALLAKTRDKLAPLIGLFPPPRYALTGERDFPGETHVDKKQWREYMASRGTSGQFEPGPPGEEGNFR